MCRLTVVADSAMVITGIYHQDFLHFPVVEVVEFSDGVLGPGDEVEEDVGGLDTGHELMLGQSFRGRSITRLLLQASVDEMTKDVAPVGRAQRRAVVLGYVIQWWR